MCRSCERPGVSLRVRCAAIGDPGRSRPLATRLWFLLTRAQISFRWELPLALMRPMGCTRRSSPCMASSNAVASVGKKTGHAAEHDRVDVRRRRETWFERQPDLGPDRVVLIDGEPSRRHRSEPEGKRNQHQDVATARSDSSWRPLPPRRSLMAIGTPRPLSAPSGSLAWRH